ncbi:MAG: rhodanese-like domain-containing protein [Aureispira sp.]
MPHQQMNIQTFEDHYKATTNAVLLDVRTPQEIAEGYLEGAIDIDFLAKDFEQNILQLDPKKSYYVYCRSGKRSEQACLLLSHKGFEQVTNLQGGYLAWLQK